ncbi:MAG TPA: CYCXC family (seleno)protein [Terriglobia bacterium]
MGKKPENKVQKRNAAPSKNPWLIAGAAAIMICIVWATLHMVNTNSAGSSPSPQALDSNGAPIALIATLSPEMYTGRAREAYQAARDIPEILAQLPCFCGCVDSLGHHNNLYCFADSHGSICDLCQDIALSAQDMHRKGMPISQIRDNIRATYGNAQ